MRILLRDAGRLGFVPRVRDDETAGDLAQPFAELQERLAAPQLLPDR